MFILAQITHNIIIMPAALFRGMPVTLTPRKGRWFPLSKQNGKFRKILRFSQGVACVDSVVLKATCTYSGNKQKVRHFRKCSTLCIELNCENCKGFADHPFRVTVVRIEPTSSLFTRPAKRNNEFCNRTCVFIRSTCVPKAKPKQARH